MGYWFRMVTCVIHNSVRQAIWEQSLKGGIKWLKHVQFLYVVIVGMSQQSGLASVRGCNEWNSFYEEKAVKEFSKKGKASCGAQNKPMVLNSVEKIHTQRVPTGFEELDRVLRRRISERFANTTSVVSLGIGKSTLILQICNKVHGDGKVLYVSGEESAEQIKLRADRLGIHDPDILFLGETDIDVIEENILSIMPKLVIIDSIQTMYSEELSTAAGSVSQVREITARIMRCCKQNAITTIIIGHVTKDGNIAGPRVLEHMVDTVLYIEGERYFSYRILRTVKNRFGSTNEIGMFEMKHEGMVQVDNPSSLLLSERDENPSGSIVVASLEGTRTILVELQALTATSVFGIPRRTANGIDYNRLTLLIAVLEKKAGLPLGNQDVYLNVVGGIRINEPALDLGVILSTASSYKNIPILQTTFVVGEVRINRRSKSCKYDRKKIKRS